METVSEVEKDEQNDHIKQQKVLTAKVHRNELLYSVNYAASFPFQSCNDLVPPGIEDGENKLQYPYSIWFTQRVRGSVSSAPSDYEDNIKLVGSFSSVGVKKANDCEAFIYMCDFYCRWSSFGLTTVFLPGLVSFPRTVTFTSSRWV